MQKFQKFYYEVIITQLFIISKW